MRTRVFSFAQFGAMITSSLSHLVTAMILSIAFYIAARARPKSDPVTGLRVVEYPMVIKALGWATMIAFGGLVFLIVRSAGLTRAPPSVVVLFGVMLIVSACMVLEFSATRTAWTEHEIVSSSPWTGEKRVLWTDIVKVTYSPLNQWFVIKSRSGVKIRLHTLLGGLVFLLRDLRIRLSPDVYTRAEEAMELLEQSRDV